jgi:hypothetical protein
MLRAKHNRRLAATLLISGVVSSMLKPRVVATRIPLEQRLLYDTTPTGVV